MREQSAKHVGIVRDVQTGLRCLLGRERDVAATDVAGVSEEQRVDEDVEVPLGDDRGQFVHRRDHRRQNLRFIAAYRPHFLVIRAKRREELQTDQRDHARQIKQRVSDLFLKALYASVIESKAGRGLRVSRVQDFRSITRRRRFGRESRRRNEGRIAAGGMNAPRFLLEAGEKAEQPAQAARGGGRAERPRGMGRVRGSVREETGDMNAMRAVWTVRTGRPVRVRRARRARKTKGASSVC